MYIGYVEYVDGRMVRAGWCSYDCYFNNIPVISKHNGSLGDWVSELGVIHGT